MTRSYAPGSQGWTDISSGITFNTGGLGTLGNGVITAYARVEPIADADHEFMVDIYLHFLVGSTTEMGATINSFGGLPYAPINLTGDHVNPGYAAAPVYGYATAVGPVGGLAVCAGPEVAPNNVNATGRVDYAWGTAIEIPTPTWAAGDFFAFNLRFRGTDDFVL